MNGGLSAVKRQPLEEAHGTTTREREYFQPRIRPAPGKASCGNELHDAFPQPEISAVDITVRMTCGALADGGRVKKLPCSTARSQALPFSMSNAVKIYDTTLRDGTQGEGINFSVTDKLLIAEKLDAFGVDYIQAVFRFESP